MIYTKIDFNEVLRITSTLADYIVQSQEELISLLLAYESYEVASDEISRTLDVLTHISENQEYFAYRSGAVTTFLPRNQPLYALTCFVLLPSLMASEVHFRIPRSTKDFLPQLLAFLSIETRFPNVHISTKERLPFLKERTALLVNPATKETVPVTEVVIFTGTSTHADQLRLAFDKRTLFITNGAGHNPIIVSETANINDAAEAALTLTMYNQGQDCAAPNSILVHTSQQATLLEKLRSELRKIEIGPYQNRANRIGPNSNPQDLPNIQTILTNNREWIDKTTPGIITTSTAIVEPTLIIKPLSDGGNFNESFAPLLFIQCYEHDSELTQYFEDPQYTANAMYVTVYGESVYINNLINREINGKIILSQDTYLHNTHLHVTGIERGTQPYGGYGYGASSISIHGKITPLPTLPQRDIFEQIIQPKISTQSISSSCEHYMRCTGTEYKNVEKILKLRTRQKFEHESTHLETTTIIDLALAPSDIRFAELNTLISHELLHKPNAEFIAALSADDRAHIRSLNLLRKQKSLSTDEAFTTQIYALPKQAHASDSENASLQLHFFQIIYQLLFKKDSGPKLGKFLREVDNAKIDPLLDV